VSASQLTIGTSTEAEAERSAAGVGRACQAIRIGSGGRSIHKTQQSHQKHAHQHKDEGRGRVRAHHRNDEGKRQEAWIGFLRGG
jgi:hypothetical protein